MSLDLDTILKMVHHQAVTKKWNTKSEYCLKRVFEELDELVISIAMREPKEKITLEGIDVIYFVIQAVLDAAPGQSLNDAFLVKYADNWIHQKKTIDEAGNPTKR